jgi:hypothetical protein
MERSPTVDHALADNLQQSRNPEPPTLCVKGSAIACLLNSRSRNWPVKFRPARWALLSGLTQ